MSYPAGDTISTDFPAEFSAVGNQGPGSLDGGRAVEIDVLEEELEDNDEESILEERLHAAEQRAEEHRQAYLRALAEMDNLRKRTLREMDQLKKFAVEGFARDMLTVADNLERALAAIPQQGESSLVSMAEGVRMVHGELMRSLGKHGVTRIQALQMLFDPNLHQAMLQVASDQVVADTVVQELQGGYLLHERLLRPAMVAVAKPSEEGKETSMKG